MCEKTKKMKGVNLMLHFLWHGYIIFPALKMDSSSKMKQNWYATTYIFFDVSISNEEWFCVFQMLHV